MKFIWDEDKRLANIKKHGVDFRDAAELFRGPVLVQMDNRQDYGEDRYIAFGFIQRRVMAMAFTEPDDRTVRVISIRKATRNEQTLFEKEILHRLGQD